MDTCFWLFITHNIENLDYPNKLHVFIIQHDMGMKWSLFLAEIYRNLFEELGVRNAQFDITASTLAFDIVVSTAIDQGYSYRGKAWAEDWYMASRE
jgi:hypothetical protein